MPVELITQAQIPLGTEQYSSRGPARLVGMTGNQLPRFPSLVAARNFVNEMKSQGFEATPSRPLLVYRTDEQRIRAWDGTQWSTPGQLTGSNAPSGSPVVIAHTRLNPGTPIQIKTGQAAGYTEIQFGNGYMPQIQFDVPFPTGILTVQVTQLSGASGQFQFTNISPIAVDVANKDRFRAFYPGETTSRAHAYTWLAVGY
ncbi:MAG: hypothetical protein Q3979_05635 [Actinomycetaceae bacterium]|nr:hypothetical protein [Actinomycetaceae bacterium]